MEVTEGEREVGWVVGRAGERGEGREGGLGVGRVVGVWDQCFVLTDTRRKQIGWGRPRAR